MLAEHLDQMIAWEEGELSEQDTIKLFQYLVDSGDAWALQGCYGRQAQAMIDSGLIKNNSKKNKIKKVLGKTCKMVLLIF